MVAPGEGLKPFLASNLLFNGQRSPRHPQPSTPLSDSFTSIIPQLSPRSFGTAHWTILETCLNFLNSQEVEAHNKFLLRTSTHTLFLPPTYPSFNLQSTLLLVYSSLYCGIRSKSKFSDRARLIARTNDYDNQISNKILLKARKSVFWCIGFNKASWFNGLHTGLF